MARFDLLLELCSRQRAKTAASAARAALGETALQQAVAGEPINRKMTAKSWRGDKGETRWTLFAITLPPPFGSLIDSDSFSAGEVGLESIPRENWPPVVIPFFGFRIMVGMGLIMLAVSWFGVWLRFRGRLETTRWFLWVAFLSFPTGFVAVLAGWFTAEVGRQPWVVYGLLRTKDAVTPSLTTGDVAFSLIAYIVVYVTIYSFGFYYIYRLLRDGPAVEVAAALPGTARAGALRGGGE